MRKPVTILQVVHGLAVGGTERVVCDLARAFNGSDFRTSVCCLDQLGALGIELQQENIRVHLLGRRPGVDFSLARRLRQLYQQEQVAIVHAHQYTPYFYAATAALGTNSPAVIFTEHGRHFPDRLRVKRAIYNQLLRLITCGYTAVSDFSRQSMIRYEWMPAESIQVVYNGIHLKGVDYSLERRKAVRQENGIDKGDRLILSIGRLDPIKDFGTLIRAFSRVLHSVPNAYLWIVGDGDEAYKQHLTGLAKQLGVADKVRFLGERKDVDALLSASDLFALASITEATSMTILEAMAASKAVVATRTGGNPELVIEGETGILVPVGDVATIAETLRILLEDAVRRESMGRAGRKRVEEHFRRDRIFAQYRHLYESV